MSHISRIRPLRSPVWLMIALSIVAIAAVACGSDDGGDGGSSGVGSSSDSGFAKIAQPEEMFSLERLEADLGLLFKESKTYDVEGLDGATAAYYGFFGPDPYDRAEVEIRLYPSHQVALDQGVSFADESTGEDAVLLEDVQRWDEGLTQRRQCAGNGGHHSGKCDNAKYGDYVIRGNMVLMCQGKDSVDALKNCEEFLDAVANAGTGA